MPSAFCPKPSLSFCAVLSKAKLRPGVLRRLVAQGSEIGDRHWKHGPFAPLPSAGMGSEIDRTNHAIAPGARPTGAEVVPALRNTDKAFESATGQTRPGSILLRRRIHCSTVAAVPRIPGGIGAKACTLVTAAEPGGAERLKGGNPAYRARGRRSSGSRGAGKPDAEVRYP